MTHADLDPWMGCAKRGEQGRGFGCGMVHCLHDPEPDSSTDTGVGALHCPAGGLEVRERLAGLGQKGPSGVADLNPAAVTAKQGGPKLLLQGVDCAGDP